MEDRAIPWQPSPPLEESTVGQGEAQLSTARDPLVDGDGNTLWAFRNCAEITTANLLSRNCGN